MSFHPTTAMLLAAGLGTRMRPLTDTTPKPLLMLGGQALVDRAIERLADAGVRRIVVNAHWHADQITAHFAMQPAPAEIIINHEPELLETGGAVLAARAKLGPEPFFVVNSDTVWFDGPTPALTRMGDLWDDGMDVLMLLHRTFQVHSEIGLGDFALDPWGLPRRPKEREIVPYIYAGVQIIRPACLDALPDGRISLNALWDRALAAGRLRALVHDGLWYHLSRPEDLAEAEFALQAQLVGTTT